MYSYVALTDIPIVYSKKPKVLKDFGVVTEDK